MRMQLNLLYGDGDARCRCVQLTFDLDYCAMQLMLLRALWPMGTLRMISWALPSLM